MNKPKLKYNILCFFLLIFNVILAQKIAKKDTISIQKTDSIKTDSIRNKEILANVVNSNAEIIKNNVNKKFTELITNAVVEYTDIEIKADYITIDWDSGEIYARGKIDSTGKIITDIDFTQAGKLYNYKETKFNFKTKKGLAFNVVTDDDELVIMSKKVKKDSDSIFFGKNNRITTDPYVKSKKDSIPDYYISVGKMKLIKDRGAVTGPIGMFIEGVPLPIGLPFAYLPTSSKRSAGLLIGSFGEREALGFYLDRWGFYVPLGETADMENRFSVYTKGSWSMNNNIRYTRRYKYNGNLNFSYDRRIESIPGLDDYSKANIYNFIWSHSTDAKANPTLSFSASVNFSSQNYYRNSISNSNITNGNFLQSSTNSSINLTKRFQNLPVSASLYMSSSQNLAEGNVDMTLPALNVSVNRQYPFARKSGAKKGLLQSMYLDYKANVKNNLKTTADDLFTDKMFDNSKTGMSQNINIGTGTTVLNYFNLNFNGSYNEIWSLNGVKKINDYTNDKVITYDDDKFRAYRTFNLGANLQTTLYGTKLFKQGNIIQGIRHMMTPSVGFSFAPDFSDDSWKYYSYYWVKDRNNEWIKSKYSYFEGSVFGSPSSGETRALTLSLANNLEMKVRNRKDSTGVKKIKIFDSFNVNTSYNFAADSLKWSNFNFSGSTSFLDSKLRANYSFTLNPYKIEFEKPDSKSGYNIDKFGHFSLSNYNIGLSFGIDQSMFGEKKDYAKEFKKKGEIRYENYYFDEENYARFEIPWSLSFNLSYSGSKGMNRETTNTASVGVSGNFSPSPYWDINFNTNYDIENNKIAYTTITFARDLRSFNINFTWVPFGDRKTWDFYFGIKANIFKDAINYKTKNPNIRSNDF